jgi:hypothetical protein
MTTTSDTLDYLIRFRERYGATPSPTRSETPVETDVPVERAFVLQAESGRTVITAPVREVALANEGFLYLNGRFVEADRPNLNGALWTSEDLELGQHTVAGGPLNWLHDEQKIVGSLLDSKLVTAREAADAGQPDIGTHITSTAAMWRFLYPREARTIEQAAADHQLFYSMECVSKTVDCVGERGCGQQFGYEDYISGRACAHLKERASTKRFNEPLFLGGAIIVPPVRPGWANADVEVVRAAAAEVERAHLDSDGLSTAQARDLATAILTWANR